MKPNKAKNLKMYSLPFVQHELRLYLDTHPDDVRALEAFNQVSNAMNTNGCGGCFASGYCQNGGSKNRESGWTWIDDPWPWEAEANIIEGEE